MDIARYIVELLPAKRPLSVLDLGCSTCMEAEALTEASIHLTGVDQDEESIRLARARVPKARFSTANAEVWQPNDGEQFDAVLMRRPDLVLGSEGWKRTFQRLPHLVVQGGTVLITTPGRLEATLARRMLQEIGVEGPTMNELDFPEEKYLVTVRINNHDEQARVAGGHSSAAHSLARELAWSDEPAWVCDARTGVCTLQSTQDSM